MYKLELDARILQTKERLKRETPKLGLTEQKCGEEYNTERKENGNKKSKRYHLHNGKTQQSRCKKCEGAEQSAPKGGRKSVHWDVGTAINMQPSKPGKKQERGKFLPGGRPAK